ncbi:MAG: hypothetical protein CVU13_08030 [Bacteroidetes bacterium HGW-Bacteroidetes-8]|jgi:hypothetical protein|nr:MAG: hypothetical protein CVU13_08030 [Bacteroidetes bacterium HGW-Bacteroidetes-8]
MSYKIKALILGLLTIIPQIMIAQSCSKEVQVPGVTSVMRSRATDFKNAIGTGEESIFRSSVYVYATRTVKKYIDNPQDLVAKLVMLGFTDVYIAYDKPSSSLYIPKSWYLTFNKLAHENGITIHALSLSNLKLYVSDEPIKENLEWINEFNNSVDATQKFDGISADLEPHILKINSTRRPEGLTLAWQESYGIGGDNDLLLKRTVEVMALAKKEMGSLTLNQALGFFFQSRYDTGLLSWGGAQQFLQHCDQVVVMAYNYQAKRVIEMATPVLTAASQYPKSVSVAVKTSLNTLGDDGPLTSFQPQGWDNLITSLKYVLAEAKKFNSFRGIDIFEFGGLEIMWESK